MSNQEIWKDLLEYEGLYQISNFGNVKSLKYGKTRILKKCKDSKGYLQLTLSKNGKQRVIKVHVLVAICFLNHTSTGTTHIVVDHIDENKINNCVNNLQLISHRENVCRVRNERYTSQYKGVYYNKNRQKYYSQISLNNKRVHLGSFVNELDAKNAYDTKLKNLKIINKDTALIDGY
jgi:hypothetical protein